MIAKLRKIWRAAPIATTILALALLVAGFFAARMIASAVYWNDPQHHEQEIAGWMTPGYVAHSWHVPREVVLDALQALDPAAAPPRRPVTIREMAERLNLPEEQVIAQLDAAIQEFRQSHADPAGPDAGGVDQK